MIKGICNYGVKLIFLCCITFVAFVVIEDYMCGADKRADKFILILIVAAALAILLLSRHWIIKYHLFFEKYFNQLLALYLGVLFVVQILVGVHLRYTPTWDLGSVYNGAISWLENGNIDAYKGYFYYFPNNLGLLCFFRGYLGLVRVFMRENPDYFVAAVVMGSVMVTLFRLSVIWITKKLLGLDYGVVMMVLLLQCIPLYFASAVFYTDVMSMAAPAVYYLIYLHSREAASWKKRTALYIVMALTAAVGMEIKFTVIITVIAVGIEMLLRGEWKKCLWMSGIHVLLITAVFGRVNHVVYSSLLDREQAKIQNTPYLHWMMMGAKGNGSYNAGDYQFTWSYTDREEQHQALKEEIGRRYRELGFVGTIGLWKAKTLNCFGDGTYALSVFLYEEPKDDIGWTDWLLSYGEHYGKYQTVCLGVFVMVMLLMFLGVLGSLGDAGMNRPETCTIWLAFFGIWLFLMFWETSPRYFLNHLSVMLIAAVIGLSYFEYFERWIDLKGGKIWRRKQM